MLGNRSLFFSLSFMLILALSFRAQGMDEERFMSVDQVKAGMKGVGKTVFSGTQIDEFQVEILGVMKNARPQGDLVLARISGGPLAETGMIQGMSGSPVYIDGKLLGATAFAWAFSKEPICGITPIEEMLHMWRQMDTQELDDWEGSSSSPPLENQELPENAVPWWPGGEAPTLSLSSAAALTPIGTPVMVSGFDQRVVDQMAPVFQKYHMTPIQAGSGAGEDVDIPLEPGASLAVLLIGGDASLSAVGTLTYREGDRIIGFGHPLFIAGGVDYPMAGAVIHSVLPSTATSFKLASTTGMVGVLRQDRRSGVAGLVGEIPATVPIDLTIHGQSMVQPEKYHFELIDNPIFTPNLVTWTALNAFLTTGQAMGDATVRMDVRVGIDDHADLHMENLFAGTAPYAALATELGEIVALLLRTHLEEVHLEDVTLDITVEYRRREARISSARIGKETIRPGEELQVAVFLEPYRGEERVIRTSLEVPDDAPQGKLMLQISDAESSISWEQRRAPHKFQFQSLDQMLTVLGGLERNNQLVVKLITARSGAVIKGQELPSLPPSALTVLRGSLSGSEGGLTHQEVLVEKRIDTDFVLSGQIVLPVRVKP